MYAKKTPSLTGHWPDVKRSAIEAEFRLSHSEYAVLITDLARLLLVEGRRPSIAWTTTGETTMVEMQLQQVIQALNERVHYEMINFTSLGVHFMAACTAPAASGNPTATG